MRRRQKSGVPLGLQNFRVPSWLPRYMPIRAPARARATSAGTRPRRARQGNYDCRVKLTVTVMMTGTGTPFSIVGVYSH
jgi:hypothetical protein